MKSIVLTGLLALTTAYAQPNVVAWGSGVVTNVPQDLTNAIRVSAGWNHALAICADGRVVGWGSNSFGQINVPIDFAAPVTQVLAASNYSSAVLSDGTVRTWGLVPDGKVNGVDALEIAHFSTNIMTLCSDGTVCMTSTDACPYSLTNTMTIAAVPTQFGAICSNGCVWLWGKTFTNVARNATNARAIAKGKNYNAIIRDDGSIVTWTGQNTNAGTEIIAPNTKISVSPYGSSVYALRMTTTNNVVTLSGNFHPPQQLQQEGACVTDVSAGNGYGLAVTNAP